MKRLYLLRHAKSSWGDPSLDDVDRPLAPRGLRAATRMGAHMAARGHRPDLALCSPALRARETWAAVRGALGGVAREKVRDGLYLAPTGRILETVRASGGGFSGVAVVGHGPGLGDLAAVLAGPQAADVFGKFPTGSLAAFDVLAGDWNEAGPENARLVAFTRPADLADGAS